MFKHDLFISYAHVDNKPLDAAQGWITLLHERLAIKLEQMLGERVVIWRDAKLQGNDFFANTLLDELAQVALLLSVLSPRYPRSEWCLRELQSFCRHALAQGGLHLDNKARVFKVLKMPISLDEHPGEIGDLLGYEFYGLDPMSGKVREFGHDIGAHRDNRYWSKLDDLAQDIAQLITKLKSEDAGQTPPTTTAAGKIVYLAETTSDLSEERDKVKRELQLDGHTVLPDRPLPTTAPALRDRVREYLQHSRLSIHLIGKHYGLIPEMESERSVVRLQQELAIERGDNAEFSRLIWLPIGLQPEDERQQRFVVDLQNSFHSRNGSELLQTKFEDLKTIIQTKLTKPPAAPVTNGGHALTKIYFVCDGQDMAAARPLRKHLSAQGYEVLSLTDGAPAEVAQDHKDNLLLCDALLIFQGQAPARWLDQKVKDLLKLQGYGRSAPLLAKAIYLGAPATDHKEDFMTNTAPVINNYGDFNPDVLRDFLAQIERAKGAQL